MTKAEKDITRKRFIEAKRKTEDLHNNLSLSDDEKNWVFLVQGPPWNQRIIKKKQKN